MGVNIIGNKTSLFSMHGEVDVDKLITAFEYVTGQDTFDIDAINKYSEKGALYVTAYGKILDDYDEIAEGMSKYKIVPTGLKLKYTNYPVFASFIKINNFWNGAYLGTGAQLFDMYNSYWKPIARPFDDSYRDVFCQENRIRDIIGFGLTEMLKNYNETKDDLNEYEAYMTDTDDSASTSTTLAKALEKMQSKLQEENKHVGNNKNKQRHLNKTQKKAARLQAHLSKIQLKEKKQAEKEEQEKANEFTWLDIIPLGESEFMFEDEQTKELNARIEAYLNESETENSVESNESVESIESIENIESIESENDFETTDDETVETETSVENKTDETYEQTDKTCEKEEDKSVKTVEKVAVAVDKNDADNLSDAEIEAEVNEVLEELNHSSGLAEKMGRTLRMDLVNDIYDRLLDKENFGTPSNLAFYLKGICIVIFEKQTKNKGASNGNGYIYSKDKKKCIINTGLLDNYGNYIYLVDHTPSVPDFGRKSVSIMYSKTALLEFNFDIEDIRRLPEPVQFTNDRSQLIFDGNIDDFDLDDSIHLKHIIKERISRFPDKYQKESDRLICDKIKSALRQAVKISKSNYRYIIPKYDFTRRTIQYLVPLFLDKEMNEKPELTIVIGETSGVWTMYTILDTNDACKDARLIASTKGTWLNP